MLSNDTKNRWPTPQTGIEQISCKVRQARGCEASALKYATAGDSKAAGMCLVGAAHRWSEVALMMIEWLCYRTEEPRV